MKNKLSYLFISLILLLNTLSAIEVDFLNQREHQYLKTLHAPLRVGITGIPNQVLKNRNEYTGFSIDMFKKIEKMLDIKFEFIYFKTWDKLLIAGKNKEIDIIFAAQKTKLRLAYYDFSDTILKQKNKIIVAHNNFSPLEITNLFGKKVAVVKNSAVYDYLRLKYPKIILLENSNELDALMMTANKITYATISEPVRASYVIKKHNISNLHITGDINYDYNLRIANRNDLPILSIILSKSIEMIPREQIETLYLKWGYTQEEVDYSIIWKIGIALLAISLLMFLWGLLLKRINKRLEYRVQSELAKNRQQQLMLFQQSRLAQMGEVLNMVAHQWRQPLNVLNALVLQMDMKLSKQKDIPKNLLEKEFIEIEETTKYMSHTINDFRDFFKPHKEKIEFYLHETIEESLRLLKPVLLHSEIKILHNYEEKVKLLGYPNEVGQVILNIINNAKDALLSNNLNTKKEIHIQLVQKDNNIKLSIEDNAGGINEEIIHYVFDPYFSTKLEKEGTGLGLYLSKMIIEKHMGGELNVENTKNGAKFTMAFNLP